MNNPTTTAREPHTTAIRRYRVIAISHDQCVNVHGVQAIEDAAGALCYWGDADAAITKALARAAAAEGERDRLGSPAIGCNDRRVGEPSADDPKLDACPRCGGRGGYATLIYRDKETRRLNGTDTFYRTGCIDCGFMDNSTGWLTRQAAADHWNKQPVRTAALAKLAACEAERDRLLSIINTPATSDFVQAVNLEATHQRERWGAAHDAGKKPADWFWLVGYLAGKALHAAKTDALSRYRHVKRGTTYEVLHIAENENDRGQDLVIYRGEDDGKVWSRPAAQFYDGRFEALPPKPPEKLLHHIITTAAALANWHHQLTAGNDMRPGIEPPKPIADPLVSTRTALEPTGKAPTPTSQ